MELAPKELGSEEKAGHALLKPVGEGKTGEGVSSTFRRRAVERVVALPPYWRATLGGILGTFAMTVWTHAMQVSGASQLDVARAFGALLSSGGEALFLGTALHVAVGIILGLIYAYGFYELLPGPGWLRGLIFSMLPTTFLLVFIPLYAWGLLIAGSLAFGPLAAALWIVNQMVYGAVLGIFYGTD
ncbi:MAG: hypothetical protein HYX94_10610 [Chloroflexi bacterium]|nr:hypothetical protein [Chloroflexota bacterium]